MVPVVHVSIAPPTILTCPCAGRMSGVPGVTYADTDDGPVRLSRGESAARSWAFAVQGG